MNWIIKSFPELTLDELYDLLKLRTDVFIVEQQCAYPDCDGMDKKALHIFLRKNDKIAAYARIFSPGDVFPEAAIGRVVVEREERGTGLSRELLERSIEYICKEMGESKIKISAQSYLLTFYASLGFVPVSNEYLEDGIPHTDMLLEKKLKL